ncbi:MAG: hypothetical protein AAF744_07505 [Pseudomonadota bacterium]
MPRFLIAALSLVLLAACANDQDVDASSERVAAAAFREAGPKSITVMTMVNNRTGQGGHTALLIKGSQTVIFDPAGSFRHSKVVEKGDVIYGVSPGILQSYKSAHARSTFHVVSQEIPVTAAQAERALQLAVSNGSVPGAFCTNASTSLMRQVPGFQNLTVTFYPTNFMEQVAGLPNVRTTRLFENDDGDIIDGVRAAELAASQNIE